MKNVNLFLFMIYTFLRAEGLETILERPRLWGRPYMTSGTSERGNEVSVVIPNIRSEVPDNTEGGEEKLEKLVDIV